MVSVVDREAVTELLRRLGREATLAFASRAALRVVPLMSPLADYSRTDSDAAGLDVMLAAWRACAASWLAAGFATGAAEVAARDFVFEVEGSLSSDTAFLFSPPLFAASSAVHAAAHAALAAAGIGEASQDGSVDAAVSAALVDAVAAMAGAAAASGGDPEAAAHAAQAAADADLAILGELGGAALLARPLWIDGEPAWVDRIWTDMRSGLEARDPNWRVWTDWQGARLNGEPPAAARIELARIVPGEFWKLGAARANAEIARRIAS
jgi:hypothetical protein